MLNNDLQTSRCLSRQKSKNQSPEKINNTRSKLHQESDQTNRENHKIQHLKHKNTMKTPKQKPNNTDPSYHQENTRNTKERAENPHISWRRKGFPASARCRWVQGPIEEQIRSQKDEKNGQNLFFLVIRSKNEREFYASLEFIAIFCE